MSLILHSQILAATTPDPAAVSLIRWVGIAAVVVGLVIIAARWWTNRK